MTNFITSSALTRLLANLFVFVALVAALFVAMVEVLKNEAINPIVYTLLSSGLVYGVSILSVHIGVVATGAGSTTDTTTSTTPPAPSIDKINTAVMGAIRLPGQQ